MVKRVWVFYNEILGEEHRSHMKAYAAEAAFFLVISLVPCILFLLTLIKYTPITQEYVMAVVLEVFPSNINAMVVSIVQEVYNKSTSVIPLTAIVALWSASRGVMSIANGLCWIYDVREKKNYFYTRIRATIYTLLFVIVIILCLLVLVFGNLIGVLIIEYIPLFQHVIHFIINVRVLVSMAVLTGIFMLAYKSLPRGNHSIKKQAPGALFAAAGWIVCSFAFSVYVNVYDGFANMYGSLTTVVLIMLWLYFCMYFMLIGAKINVYIDQHF